MLTLVKNKTAKHMPSLEDSYTLKGRHTKMSIWEANLGPPRRPVQTEFYQELARMFVTFKNTSLWKAAVPWKG